MFGSPVIALWKVILFTLKFCVLPLVFRNTSLSHTHVYHNNLSVLDDVGNQVRSSFAFKIRQDGRAGLQGEI